MGKQIFGRIKITLSILFAVFVIASVTITVSTANYWDGKESFNKEAFNKNYNENADRGFVNGTIKQLER